MDDAPLVVLPPLGGPQRESWVALVEVAPALGETCLLVGGQMVFLHEVERGASATRPTVDVDVVVNLRVEPTALPRVHRVLTGVGFAQEMPSADNIAHRYLRGDATLDVLAPDNIGARASLKLGSGRTIQAPGTSQALRRSGAVRVVAAAAATPVLIRRPTLVGALLAKLAAATKITSHTTAARAKHLRDLESLATLLGPSDRAGADLSKNERRALREIAESDRLGPLARQSIELLANS